MSGASVAESANVLGRFLGMRDVNALTREQLMEKYGFPQADVMVLFGGSILCGVNVLADAMKNGVAKWYMIAGGEGHTTQSLREWAHREIPQIETRGKAEADVFAQCLEIRYGLKVDFLERKSTNCGNNVTYCLELLERESIDFQNILLVQDASMQRRMDAGFRKHIGKNIPIINYAAYRANIIDRDGTLRFDRHIWGMWDMVRYISLLLGEIPRLYDAEGGYGPKGKGFIAHVDIPNEVWDAFLHLKRHFGDIGRVSDPSYAE